MFVAYEAIAILPENLGAIKTKLTEEELDKYEELLKDRVRGFDLNYIIFNVVGNLLDSKLVHTVVPRDLLTEYYNVAHFTDTILWITKKN